MLPSVKYQSEYDLWFINKAMDYLSKHIKQSKGDCESLDRYEKIIKKVEEVTIDELNF